MSILILLGKDDQYLDYKIFKSDQDMDIFLQKIHPLIMANIENKLSLKERLTLLPPDVDYFPLAGAVHNVDFIEEEKLV